jgi:hypothetical protein
MATRTKATGLILDLTDAWQMPADSAAGVFAAGDGRCYVAWGQAALAALDFRDHDAGRYARLVDRLGGPRGTTDNGIEAFPSAEQALAYAGEVAAIHREAGD